MPFLDAAAVDFPLLWRVNFFSFARYFFRYPTKIDFTFFFAPFFYCCLAGSAWALLVVCITTENIKKTTQIHSATFYSIEILCSVVVWDFFSYIISPKSFFPPFSPQAHTKRTEIFFFRFEQKNRDWIAPVNGEIFQWADALGRLWTLYLLFLIIHKLMTLHCRGSLGCSVVSLRYKFWSNWFSSTYFSLCSLLACTIFPLTRIWILRVVVNFPRNILRWPKYFLFYLRCLVCFY